MSEYRTALYCLNGHLVTGSLEYATEKLDKFCLKCGEPLISKCPNCATKIRGDQERWEGGLLYAHRPNNCSNCGNPYPWTIREMEAVKELLYLSELSENEQKEFLDDLSEIAKKTPKEEPAKLRINRKMSKVGNFVIDKLLDLIAKFGVEMIKSDN